MADDKHQSGPQEGATESKVAGDLHAIDVLTRDLDAHFAPLKRENAGLVDRYIQYRAPVGIAAAWLKAVGRPIPGEAGQPSGYTFTDLHERKIRVQRYTTKLIRVSVKLGGEESLTVEHHRRFVRAQGAALQKARELDEKAAALEACFNESGMPKSSDEFASNAAVFFWTTFQTFDRVYGNSGTQGDSGYRLDRGTVDEVIALATEIYWLLKSRSGVQFHEHRRMAGVRALRAEAAKHDLPLQRLIATVALDARLGGRE